ncbi:hypothetical protein HYH03_005210 [Edaphochlamys debaryana]|uniref:Cilia- and flagella-associated protein 91 n=1 Tax=Edaphochlamys debaryana TaxID=47281 RepID=A0A835Y6A9_9CHLO|nr:hypothetical protein HYH03_005210 [Edaphochlamys debaryana]|eukprot:KAG2496803.1 hypothetical protein HYH03_005210 [Edaphochlamys debaryana]
MAQPTRPYDALYDPSFTVAGPRDHYRQQTLGGGFNIERAPVYNNFFSELPHHPPSTLRLKNGDKVPAFVDRNFRPADHNSAELQQRSAAAAVSGHHRPKYFRRPMLAGAEIHIKQATTLPPLGPQSQDLNATAPARLSTSQLEPRSKTIGTQSDYRENEAQTAPWEPGYVLPAHPTAKQQALSQRYNTDGPEVLTLKDMTFADGLPAGLAEVTRIDKMRAKRAFEATLPPIDDVARLPLRQKMIEEWEAKEWAEREAEIEGIQEARLALLDNALQVREEEMEADNQARVEARKQAMLAAKAGKFADVQATRIKTMRQLIENRKYVEKHRKLHKPTIVERYANFGSGTYAPMQREGRFPESKPLGKEIETEGYAPVTLRGVAELETFLPSRLLNPKIAAPKRPTRLDYNQRKEAAVQKDLKAINDLLDTSKSAAGRGFGDCWPAPLKDDAGSAGGAPGGGLGAGSLSRAVSTVGKQGLAASAPSAMSLAPGTVSGSPSRRVIRAIERPATPELPQPPAITQPQRAALVLLQRLLRGRAAQNIMYEGRMRRQELVDELRLAERTSTDASGFKLDSRPVPRPEDRDAATIRVDALIGTAVAEICALLCESDPAKRDAILAGLEESRAHAKAAAMAAAARAREEEEAEATAARAAAAAAEAAAAAISAAEPEGGYGDEDEGPGEAAEAAAGAAAEAAYAEVVAEAADPDRAAVVNLEALGITREQAEAAAVRVQAAARGYLARKEVAAMRERGEAIRRVMASGEDAEAKVVQCQAAIRGYLDRKRVKELKAQRAAPPRPLSASAARPPSSGRPASGRPASARRPTSAPRAAAPEPVREQASQSDFDPASYSPEHVEAITRIQAAQRGRIARKQVAELRSLTDPASGGAASGDGAGASGAAAEPAEWPEYSSEQEQAAILIQAAGRGMIARAQVRALKGGAPHEATAASSVPSQPQASDEAAEAQALGDGGEGEAAVPERKEGGEGDVWPHMLDVAGTILQNTEEELHRVEAAADEASARVAAFEAETMAAVAQMEADLAAAEAEAADEAEPKPEGEGEAEAEAEASQPPPAEADAEAKAGAGAEAQAEEPPADDGSTGPTAAEYSLAQGQFEGEEGEGEARSEGGSGRGEASSTMLGEPSLAVGAAGEGDAQAEAEAAAAEADEAGQQEPELAPEAEPEPDLAPEAEAAPEAQPEAEPEAQAEAEPEPEAQPEAEASAQQEPELEAQAEPSAGAEAEAEPEAQAEPSAAAEPEPEPEAEAEPEASAAAGGEEGFREGEGEDEGQVEPSGEEPASDPAPEPSGGGEGEGAPPEDDGAPEGEEPGPDGGEGSAGAEPEASVAAGEPSGAPEGEEGGFDAGAEGEAAAEEGEAGAEEGMGEPEGEAEPADD